MEHAILASLHGSFSRLATSDFLPSIAARSRDWDRRDRRIEPSSYCDSNKRASNGLSNDTSYQDASANISQPLASLVAPVPSSLLDQVQEAQR